MAKAPSTPIHVDRRPAPDASSPHMPDMGIGAESIIQKLVEERQEADRKRAIIIEKEGEWRKAANQLFGGRNGKLFIKLLLRQNGLFRPDTGGNMTKMLEDRGARNVYLQLIRPYLTPELLSELETQN